MGVSNAPAVTYAREPVSAPHWLRDPAYPKSVEVFPKAYHTDRAQRGRTGSRPPVPLAASSGTFEATAFGQICPSLYPRQNPPDGEDCLNLNLYRPAGLDYTQKDGKLRLPVSRRIRPRRRL